MFVDVDVKQVKYSYIQNSAMATLKSLVNNRFARLACMQTVLVMYPIVYSVPAYQANAAHFRNHFLLFSNVSFVCFLYGRARPALNL